MADRIVHFGIDECRNTAVLAANGYLVENCGDSLTKLSEALRQDEADAVIFSEDAPARLENVIEVARSLTSSPLVLFQGVDRSFDPARFDVVVPCGSHPGEWLRQVAQVVQRSSAIRAHSASVRQQSASLRQESSAIRMNTRSECECAARQCTTEPANEIDAAGDKRKD